MESNATGAAHGAGAGLGVPGVLLPGGKPAGGWWGSTYTMSLSSSRVSGGGLIRT